MDNLKHLFSIPLNNKEISQKNLNIEEKKRNSNFVWKGQFSPQFIESMLRVYGKGRKNVLDPFSGSGTVLYEASLLDIEAVGVELNPSAYFMSKFYEISNLSEQEQLKLIDNVDTIINNMLNEKDLIKFFNILKSSEGIFKDLLCLIVVLTNIKKGQSIEILNVIKAWNIVRNNILLLEADKNIKAYNRDFRESMLEDEKFELVLTSPPYINVFNYHENYRASTEVLGYDILNIAKAELGSNRKNRGNRFYTVIQYTLDMSLIINEVLRVAKNNARIIFIVGRKSKVLGIDFYNSEIIIKIFEDIFEQKVCQRQERNFKNRFGQNIIEDILHIDVNKVINDINNNTIEFKARNIAKFILLNADIKEAKTENILLLKQAILKVDNILPSERIVDKYDR